MHSAHCTISFCNHSTQVRQLVLPSRDDNTAHVEAKMLIMADIAYLRLMLIEFKLRVSPSGAATSK